MAETPEFYIYPSKTTVTYLPEVIKFQMFNALPNRTVNHVFQNASTVINHKLYQTCKLFLDGKTFDISENLTTNFDAISIWEEYMVETTQKIWLVGTLLSIHNRNCFSQIFTKLIFVNVRSISFSDQNITYSEFLYMVSPKKVETFSCSRCSIKYLNGKWVELVEIMKKLPAIKDFLYLVNDYASQVYTPETAIKIALLTPFENLISMNIGKNVPERFSNSNYFQNFLLRHPQMILTNHHTEQQLGLWNSTLYDS